MLVCRATYNTFDAVEVCSRFDGTSGSMSLSTITNVTCGDTPPLPPSSPDRDGLAPVLRVTR